MPLPFMMMKHRRGEDYEGASVRMQLSSIGVAALIVCIAVSVPLSGYLNNPVPAIVGVPLGLYLLFAIRVADQWQKAAVLRLGRYIGLRGPGVFMILPVVDELRKYVDQRVSVPAVKAASALTRVPGPA